MNTTTYFLNLYNWSFTGLLFLVIVIVCYIYLLRTNILQKFLFCTSALLIYLVVGSPIANLESYGLHSSTMLQHIILLMIAPILILKSLPSEVMNLKFITKIPVLNQPKNYFIGTWIIGALAMWLGHFLSAAMTSSKYGLVICGISAPKNSWITAIPEALIYCLLIIAGILFALPVFHPNKKKRLHPLKSVIYLFTACVSCSSLGLYVTFMASSAVMENTVAVFSTLRSPFPMTIKTDQELAGLMMWVPGCILYVISSIEIVLHWYDDNTVINEKELKKVSISDH